MRTLEAIIFDFERRRRRLPALASAAWRGDVHPRRAGKAAEFAPHAELVVSGLDVLTLDMLVTLVNRET